MAKPIGNITRGTTAPNRLRRIDRWLIERECGRLRSLQSALVVDLGYGATPITAWELRQRLADHVREDVQVVGIEIDPARVAQGQPLADETLKFVRGGFEVPTEAQPDVIRAANVLRQYQESEVWPAWKQMGQRLNAGGLLIDATCDEIGRLGSWIGVRKMQDGTVQPETFTISVHVGSLDKPSAVAARLPKLLIHHNLPGEPIHTLLEQLDDAWLRSAGQRVFGPRAQWIAMCEYATAHGLVTLDQKSRWRLGELTLPWAVVSS